jgi:hypothetical protein
MGQVIGNAWEDRCGTYGIVTSIRFQGCWDSGQQCQVYLMFTVMSHLVLLLVM